MATEPAPSEAGPEVAAAAALSSGALPPNPPKRHRATIDVAKIDPDVQKVVRRLVRHGYEAYLVGGCVRDLLLDHAPKDFDVATSARPEQVRQLFRNSRIIGRRFRLVHILFHGGKVIEVATFRRNPRDVVFPGGAAEEIDTSPEGRETPIPDAPAGERGGRSGRSESADRARRASTVDVDVDVDALLIRTDNAFGEAHEDSARRDFTINALFYDVERHEILDWVGGMDDIERRIVNTIGDPEVRFSEDPVRILRALKFAGRLDLGIKPSVYDAIVFCRDRLALAARPRVSEEILRLLRGGEARRTIFLAWETGVLDVLLPELSSLLYDAWSDEEALPNPEGEGLDSVDRLPAGARVFRLLGYIDKRTRAGKPLDDSVLWTLLLLEPLKEACDNARDRAAAAADFLEPLVDRLAIPRRFADSMKRILGVLPRLQGGRAGRFARTEIFELAVEVAQADLAARGVSNAALRSLVAQAQAVPQKEAASRDASSREASSREASVREAPARDGAARDPGAPAAPGAPARRRPRR